MAKSLGAYRSDNVLFQEIQREQWSTGVVENGDVTLEQLKSRQKVSGSSKSTWNV